MSKSLSLLQSGRRSIHVSAVSAAKQTMPDPIEHATGNKRSLAFKWKFKDAILIKK